MTINHYDKYHIISIYYKGTVNQQSMSTSQSSLQIKTDCVHQMSVPQVVKPTIALLDKVLWNFI
jgi:hypothetical protein